MDISNNDLRQKLNSLQHEMSSLESLALKTTSSEEKLKEEKCYLNEELSRLSKALEQKTDNEQKLQAQVSKLEDSEERNLSCISQLMEKEREYIERISIADETVMKQKEQIAKMIYNENYLSERISELEEISKKQDSVISTLKAAEEEFKFFIEELKREKDDLSQRVKYFLVANEELTQKSNENVKIEKDVLILEKDLLQEHTKVADVLEQVEKLTLQNDILCTDIERLRDENANLASKLHLLEASTNKNDNFSEKISSLSEAVKKHQTCNENLNQSLESLNQQLKTKQEELFTVCKKEKRNLNLLNEIITLFGDEKSIYETKSSNQGETDGSEFQDLPNRVELHLQGLKGRIESVLENNDLRSLELKSCKEELEHFNVLIKQKDEEIDQLNVTLSQQKQLERAQTIITELPPEECSKISSLELRGTEIQNSEVEFTEDTSSTHNVDPQSELKLKLKELRERYEEEKRQWQSTMIQLSEQNEATTRSHVQRLTQQWNNERKELERLAQVATDAFKSGTGSVDLLKEQIAQQRAEIEELRRNHMKEVEELQALLEVKRRRAKGFPDLKSCSSLEEAAEFEYLKNILYQYMMGKETLTLSKVLCAVVKFNRDQQREIIEHEQRKQNILKEKLKLEKKLQQISKNPP